MDTILKDIKYSARTLLKSPGFTLVAIVILTLGIGAGGTIFSVVNEVLLKPLPYLKPDRLVRIYGVWSQGNREGMSAADFTDYRAQMKTLESMAAQSNIAPFMNLSGAEKPVQIRFRYASAGLFSTLGITPIQGREFTREEETPGGPHVVMLTHTLWSNSYGKDPSIVGRQLNLNDLPYTVVGVLPPFFDMRGYADAYLPEQQNTEDVRKTRSFAVIGRLKDGTTIQNAQSEFDVISKRLAQAHSDVDKDWRTSIMPLQDEVVRNFRPALFMLLSAVALVTLIVAATTAILMLARVSARRAEIAVRIALGASRTRLGQQLLIENLIITLCSGALGSGVTYLAINLVKTLGPTDIPRISLISVDIYVLLFMFCVAVVIAVFLAFIPLFQTRKLIISDDMKTGSRRMTSGIGLMQTGLMVAEIAFTVTLLIGTGLLFRSLLQLQSVDPGFRTDHLLSTRIVLPFNRYNSYDRLSNFWRELLAKVEALPDVESAAAISEMPLGGLNNPTPFTATTEDKKVYFTYVRSVSPNYLQFMKVPLLAGRHISWEDRLETQRVVVINDVFKREVFGDQDPLGKHLVFPFERHQDCVVVGVVGNVHHASLAAPPAREAYVAIEQGPVLGYNLMVRTRPTPESLIRPIQQIVWSMDPDEAMAPFRTMDNLIYTGLTQERFRSLVVALFAFVALILSSIGLYGVLSYLVSQRTQEIGIRMALGAQRESILRLFLGRGARIAFVGLGVGLATALVLAKFLKSLLFGIKVTDPLTFGGVSLVIVLIGLAASLFPAWRATKVNPVYALRNE
jgi:putative ABC transport system permease protein